MERIYGWIRQAKKLGYEIEVHYVGVENVEIAKQRISYRVLHIFYNCYINKCKCTNNSNGY